LLFLNRAAIKADELLLADQFITDKLILYYHGKKLTAALSLFAV
jgi:hypothetical protein